MILNNLLQLTSRFFSFMILNLFILVDFPRNVDRLSMELPILHFEGSQVKHSKF